jgi:hypothetical protein
MRRFFVVLGLLLVAAAPAMAQNTPQLEVFGGYTYLRATGRANINMNGWQASTAVNFNDWLGLAADVSGVYEGRLSGDFNWHSIVAGPRFTYRKEEATAPFMHVLFGVTRANDEFNTLIGGGTTSTNTFTTVVGGGIDFKIGDRWAVRAGQLDWVLTKFLNDTQSNFRYSAGVVFRWGQK